MRKIHLFFVSILLLWGGCTEEMKLITDDPGVNEWLHQTMKKEYLWSSQMPDINSTDLNTNPQIYFNTYIRYRANTNVDYKHDTYGDRFSRIQEVSSTKSGGYAMDYGMDECFATKDRVNDYGLGIRTFESTNGNVNYVQIVYVVPRSPADLAGVKRGDRFNIINGVRLPAPKSEVVFELAQPEIKLYISYPENRQGEITLSKAYYYDDPVIFDTVFDTSPRTAYLVYNHFSTGESDRFLNELNGVFERFKLAGVENFILDMRYNGGGELTVARHLASLIARHDMLGQTLVYKESSRSYGNKNLFSSEEFAKATSELAKFNINTQNFRVICSENTASASELIMHAFKTYYGEAMKVIGERTVGKNVGSIEITNKRYLWKLNPITVRVYNKDYVSGYEKGIAADVGVSEVDYQHPDIWAFGDTEREKLLVVALNSLFPGDFPSAPQQRSVTKQGEQGRVSTFVAPRGLILDQITIP